jgi:competence CoiA-like predicted nuclease
MLYAIKRIGESKIKATKGDHALCPHCKTEVISKCGDIYIHHWAHKEAGKCDPWREGETDWHRRWKAWFKKGQAEVTVVKNGVEHVADVAIDLGNDEVLYVEFQNSPISPAEIQERQDFYGNIAWVFNIQECYPDRFQITFQEEHSTFLWLHPRSILSANKIFLDYKPDSQLLFHIKNSYDSQPLTGWGLVIESHDMLNFALMKKDWPGFYAESHKLAQCMFDVGRHKRLAEYKTKYYASVYYQFEEKGFLSGPQEEYLADVVKFWKEEVY